MDPNYEELALLRAREPGLQPPRRHLPPHQRRRARRQVASVLRRVANRLDH
jgi:hypothetical protein